MLDGSVMELASLVAAASRSSTTGTEMVSRFVDTSVNDALF